jgi:hypothetical protein
MKSDIDIKDDVYKIINHSQLEQAVTGVLKKTKRPHNSKSEDIVISVLSNKTAQQQEAFVNVNIYVKDDDVDGQDEECSPRLRQLCQLAFDLFLNVRGHDFRLSLDTQQVMEVEGTGEHLINNKLLYQIINE